ncbi:hypothetical protein [Natronoglycomyces albus]|nr:hypothetical protein [Natronoglycomyces albus]
MDDVPQLAGATSVTQRIITLRRLDDTVAGSQMLPIVLNEIEACRAAGPSAELYQLAGWIASDLGQYALAEHAYLKGADAARAAGDIGLTAQLFSCLAYQKTNISLDPEALLLAQTAAQGTDGKTGPLVEALILERVAWAAAKQQNSSLTLRTLDKVQLAYERHQQTKSETPDWTYWLNQSEIDIMAGRCLIALGNPAKAAPLIAKAVAEYPPEHIREVALYQTWLAEGYARAGNRDSAEEALANAAQLDVDSERVSQRLNLVNSILEPHLA